MERKSEAIEPGRIKAIGTASTLLMDATEADLAAAVIFINNSTEDVTVRPAADGAAPGLGVVLKAQGGTWREEQAATAFCACHHGAAGTVNLSVVIL